MKILRRIRYWLDSARHYDDLAQEMEFHRAMLEANGEKPAAMGNAAIALEESRGIWIWPWLESVLQDIRYALRNLKRQPGFALVAILALGAAIGLNVSLFTVFDAVALRLYPVEDPPRFVKIFSLKNHVNAEPGFSIQELRYLASHTRTFSGLIAMHGALAHFGFEPIAKSTHGMFVAADHFEVLGLAMQQGRGFRADEDSVDAPQSVIVLSDSLWRDHFAGDPAIVGKLVRLDDHPFTVIGVAAKNFLGTSQGREDFWVPLSALPLMYPSDRWPRNLLANADACCSFVAGRLKRGVSREQATAELDVLSRQFHTQFHLEPARVKITEATMIAGNPESSVLTVFGLMFVAVTLVVLLACANTGNLLLARAAARRREMEVRRALGAGRPRLIRQLLTESLLLSCGAVTVGLALAWHLPTFAVRRMVSRNGEFPPLELTPDLTVLLYALTLAVLTCLGFGLAPALHGTQVTQRNTRLPLRSILLSVQVAISIALLIGAGLLVESIQRVRAHDPGFSIRDVAVVSIQLPPGAYDRSRIRSFSERLWRELRERGELMPFALTAHEPLGNSLWSGAVRLPGEDQTHEREVPTQAVSTGYFDVLRIPILAGRDFGPADNIRSIVVNETMARQLWGDADPIGKTILTGNLTREVVGVVRDSYSLSLDRVEPTFYAPFGGGLTPKVLVRLSQPGAAQGVEATAAQIETRARTETIPLAYNAEGWGTGFRVCAQMAGMLGLFALALAAIGLAGVFAYVVEGRTKEIGIRMALGARQWQVIALMLGSTSRAVAAGLFAGYIAAIALAKLMGSFLFGVSGFDLRVYVAAGLVLSFAGLAAAFVPVRRAAKIDPSTALRCD